jgi:glutathione S-transferase
MTSMTLDVAGTPDARLKEQAISERADRKPKTIEMPGPDHPITTERSKQRVANFYTGFEARLKEVEFVAGDRFSAADITMLVTVDFATQAFAMPIPDDSVALKRWYDAVSARPSAAA